VIVRSRLAPLLLLVACGEWESSGTWEPRICSAIPTCDFGLHIAVTRREPLRASSYDVELVSDIATHVWSCVDRLECTLVERPFDDDSELASVEATPEGFDVWMIRSLDRPFATGPDEAHLRVLQHEGMLFEAELVPSYEITHEDRCHVCELAEVELELD
jgi:hypothetical protein